jgi:hypothetical protein
MAFEVLEQGRNCTMYESYKGYCARVAADLFIFFIYWNEKGLVGILNCDSDEVRSDKRGLKFDNMLQKLQNRKSMESLKQYLVQWMDKKISDAQYGKLENICEYHEGTESCYDPEDNYYVEATNEQLIYKGIHGDTLVSDFGLTFKNDTPELRKPFVRDLQFQKKNVMDAINR